MRFRDEALAGLEGLLTVPEAGLADAARALIAPDCRWDVSHPLPPLVGPEAVVEGFLLPLRRALRHVRRRDNLFIGGANRRAEGGDWVAASGHYMGNHRGTLWGVLPSDRLALLRTGEFYRIEGGRITVARIILDLPDLMRQAGRMPFPFSYGTEGIFPAPATQDGVLPRGAQGALSLDLVERMLGALHVFDPETFGSDQQTGEGGTWAEDMAWYGPCGIGANYRWEGFVKDHRESFLRAFPDRKGGNHYCRIGDGDYAAVSGWPSMTMTHQGEYLGVPPDGRALTLRVMDFYRCAGGRIAENWVHLDYMHLMAQMGVDLLARQARVDPLPS